MIITILLLNFSEEDEIQGYLLIYEKFESPVLKYCDQYFDDHDPNYFNRLCFGF